MNLENILLAINLICGVISLICWCMVFYMENKVMEIKFGKLIECIAIIPNLNLSWVKFSKGTIYYIQFAWIRWYIQLVINKENCLSEIEIIED